MQSRTIFEGHVLTLTNMQYVDATSNETLSIYSPHDESLVLNGVQVASQADVDKAVAAARAACEYDQDS